MSNEQEYQFEVGQHVIIRRPGLLEGTTGKVERREIVGTRERFAMYLIAGSWYPQEALEPRTLDAFELFLVEKGVLDLYDRADKIKYRVRAVLPDGRIQGEYCGGNESWQKKFATFTGTRTEVEAFLRTREQDMNAL